MRHPAASPHVAAIGSELAGEMYGLHVLFDHIDDRPNEIMRFLVISCELTKPSGDDKTSLMFTTADRPAHWSMCWRSFSRGGVNLTHIDKRPERTGELGIHLLRRRRRVIRTIPSFAAVIAEVRQHCKELTMLGSYPRSKRVL